jgi:predicted transcriptional regulator YdeE
MLRGEPAAIGRQIMTSKSIRWVLLALALAWTDIAQAADPPAATQPAEASMSDVRVQSFKPYTYVFVSTETTLNSLQSAINVLIPKVDAAIESGQLRPSGPVIFTYHGASEDRNKKFMLEVGAMVKDGTAPPAGFRVITVPATQCATTLYSGPVQGMQAAFGKVYGEIARRGLQPSDVFREAYLYWEDPDSANNVVQIRVELAPGL